MSNIIGRNRGGKGEIIPGELLKQCYLLQILLT